MWILSQSLVTSSLTKLTSTTSVVHRRDRIYVSQELTLRQLVHWCRKVVVKKARLCSQKKLQSYSLLTWHSGSPCRTQCLRVFVNHLASGTTWQQCYHQDWCPATVKFAQQYPAHLPALPASWIANKVEVWDGPWHWLPHHVDQVDL